MNPRRTLIHAAMIADGTGLRASPGAILVEGRRILAAGTPESIGRPPDRDFLDRSDALVLPALANAHCHLDLTHIGPIHFTGNFVSWIDAVRSRRAVNDAEIEASVRLGATLSRVGGTAIVGDIAGIGSLAAVHALRKTGLAGVSYLEVFGLGARQQQAIARLHAAVEDCPSCEGGVVLGLQPHAPYSCGIEVYRAAAAMNRPLATHLAETLEELDFIAHADGPLAEMIKRFGVWDDAITGCGRHPVEYLAPILQETPIVAAHLNYLNDAHLALLAAMPITVVYCPRASAYFGHPHADQPAHRYQQMLEAGVNVALGTDSILCLDTPDRLSVLDEARLLYRRDGADPVTLLRMATINGAVGLGFDPELLTLSPGPTAGLLAVAIDPRSGDDPLKQAMRSDAPPQWLIGPFSPQPSWITATTWATIGSR